MPSRGRKRASRQAQLSQKKRRGRAGASARTFDAGPTEPREARADCARGQQRSGGGSRGGRIDAPGRAAPPATARLTPNTPMVYRYLGRELRQIGILAAVMAAALVALTFVLG